MYCRPLRVSALLVCSMLASCASSPPPASGLQTPLPTEYAQRCPAPPAVATDAGMDAVAVALKAMYDAYGLCAGRMANLLIWLEQAR